MDDKTVTAPFRSGFVNIVGHPNVGKSTLINALIGERMSIITPKPQTTRHRIIGILNGEHYQIVFSDTPGYIQAPAYAMHRIMNRYVESTLEDADLFLFVVDPTEPLSDSDLFIPLLSKAEAPILLVVNKSDLVQRPRIEEVSLWWSRRLNIAEHLAISALKGDNLSLLLERILNYLPEGPAYYPPDQLSDRPERFFASEIIREKIFLLYEEEIPYSCEVSIESFQETTTKDGLPLARIHAVIYVLRESQKPILLGKEGSAIKKLGTLAREELERFLQCKVFLQLTVKVRENWRDNEVQLKQFGYE
ncbi:MAG: GTPase Era [Saprospiraceae bacterium]|nr:GTPase Era [Saprospiraceae bacterium]MDW8484079.1 GTPase Era [Saprospiraceae bacterium]